SHLDMRDGIDPQARSVAARQAAIEQVNTIRNFRKHWIELLIEELEARNLGVPQIDDHACALRRLDAGVTHGVAQGLCLVRHDRIRSMARSMARASSPHGATRP